MRRCMVLGLILGMLVTTALVVHAATATWTVGPGAGYDYSTIQAAIDAADSGDTIEIAAGTYTENIALNKRVNLIGAGGGAGGTIITQTQAGAGDARVGVIQLQASGLSNAEPILIQGIRIQPDHLAGLSVGRFCEATGSSVSYIALDDVQVIGTNTNPSSEQERGLYVDLTSTLSHVAIQDCAFDNLTYGWYFQKSVSADASTVTDITVVDTTFNHNNLKGIYAEKLNNALFTSCMASGNGFTDVGVPSYFLPWMAGIDINLKAGTYSNLVFEGCAVTNNGLGGAVNGVGLTVKARGTGDNPSGSYTSFPATVDGVSILGGTYTGNIAGIRIGEPGKGNATPTGVVLAGTIDISGNTPGNDFLNLLTQSAPIVDATGVTFVGASDPFAMEDLVHHALDDETLGLVVWNAANVYVTEDSGSIQRAVDVVEDHWTVNVSSSSVPYAGNIIVYKEGITLRSEASWGTVIDASRVDRSSYTNEWGNSVDYTWAETYDPGLLRNGFLVWADDVTIDGFFVVGALYPSSYNRGIGVLIGSISTTYAGFVPWNLDEWSGLVSPVDTPTPSGVTVRNMLIVDASDGIYIWKSNNNTIEDSFIIQAQPLGGSGVILYGGGTGNVVQRNFIALAADGVSICGEWPDQFLDVGGTRVELNELIQNTNGLKFYNVDDPSEQRVIGQLNVIEDNVTGVLVEGGHASVPELHFNSISGNSSFGVRNQDVLSDLDATLNWWGSADGPTHASNPDGDGDAVTDHVIFSPWLGIDPDEYPGTVGVQLISPMLIVVDEVGPPPTEGYLNAAIAGANSVLLDGHDTIEVRPGTYDVDEEITDGVSILSTEGACETTLTGEIEIGTAGVLLGEIRNGFRIDGNVRVMPGQDGSLSALHWNDIYGMVENAGIGTLDATYNFWGAGGPIVQTIGSVDVYPDLPLSSCTIIGYIDDDGMTVAEALIFGGMIAEGYSEAFARTATEIVMRCGIGNRQALGLILEYGHGRVKSALRRTGTCEEFYELLEGYAMPAGAGGAAPESVVVGEPLNVALVIVDPLTGDAVTDALVTVTVCREDVEPVEIAYFGVLPYDAETGMYGDAIDTTGWEPGTYRIYMGTDRMSWSEDVVEVVAP